MTEDYRFLLLWNDPKAGESIQALRAACQRDLGTDASGALMGGLRMLLSAGLICRQGAAWELTESGRRKREQILGRQAQPSPPVPQHDRPPLAPTPTVTSSQLDGTTRSGSTIRRKNLNGAPETRTFYPEDSPCGHLRRLIAYYIDCARLDERPSSVLYSSDYNRSFISLPLHSPWWAENASQLVQVALALRKAQSDFAKSMARAKTDDLFVGYPIFVLPSSGDDRSALVVPIFCIPANAELLEAELRVTLDFEDADVNADWLQKQFSTNEERRAFLKACGLVDPDEDESDAIPTDFLRLPSAVAALGTFCGKAVVDSQLRADWTKPLGDFSHIDKGIHNAAVLYVGKRLTYNAGLLIELRKMLASATDEDLRKTALWHVFGPGSVAAVTSPTASPDAAHSPPRAECRMEPVPFLQFNYEQEQAIDAALNSQLTVITGPPGTGKSQVAANLLANLAVNGLSGLFASRNHKALDAVVPRTNDIVGETILRRTKNPDTGETFTWRNAVEQILSTPADSGCRVEHERSMHDVKRLLSERRHLLDVAELWTTTERDLGEATQRWDEATQRLSADVVREIKVGSSLPRPELIEQLRGRLLRFPKLLLPAWWCSVKRFYWRLRHWKAVQAGLDELRQAIGAFGMSPPEPRASSGFCGLLTDVLDSFYQYAELHDLHLCIERLQAQAKGLRPVSEVVSELEELLDRLMIKTPDLLRASMRRRFTQLVPEDRRRLVQMRGVLGNLEGAALGDGASIRWQRFFEDQFAHLTCFFPLWAVPNLSVRRGLPLAPAIIDMLIIDEASQCDIASVIPLLYRAKRATVIGDPNQLRPVHRLMKPRNQQLLRKHGLMAPQYMQYDFIQNSFFDLASSSPVCGARIQLRDHFRCHTDIASYFNDVFYNRTLRVLTSEDRMKVPRGRKAGIHWTDVIGNAEQVPPSGAICHEEIEAVGQELLRMLVTERFEGSVGVVTPFKIQAQRIRDWAEKHLPAGLHSKCEFIAATADGFQGDERDVILCSPVLQPGIPRGAMWFISENRNLWNVAVSRARALLHVMGNREMCLNSGIKHIATLVQRSMMSVAVEPDRVVFESPWERRLFDALVVAGIKPLTQYPLAGHRLDLAIPGAKLDIEIDGERYHRDEAGRRKAEDLWRDVAIKAAGWVPLRFWVYELRDNMQACVERVQQHLSRKE